MLVSVVPKGGIQLLRVSFLESGRCCDSPMGSRAKRPTGSGRVVPLRTVRRKEGDTERAAG